MILLDTHVVIWATEEKSRLGTKARDMLADPDATLRYSAITAWELGMLVSKNKMQMPLSPDALMRRVRDAGVVEVAVDGAMALDAGALSNGLHGDPCDRILIATARALSCPLLTADRKILAYAAAGHLTALDARV
jgi:PIN domain nuclease of toxin-antitoxin system